MKLTLEGILELFPDKNFICLPWEQKMGGLFFLRLFFHKPYLDHEIQQFVTDGYDPRYFTDLQVSSVLLDYSGDWRDSLRSKEDIKPASIDISPHDQYSYHGKCNSCRGCATRGANFCGNCGIKLNWVK